MYDSVNSMYMYITILTSLVWIPTMLALVAHLAYRSYRQDRGQDSRLFAEEASKNVCFFQKDRLKMVSASIEG